MCQLCMDDFIATHEKAGHIVVTTVAGAPGIGRGTWCRTCEVYGPNTIRILTPSDVR